MLMTPAIVTLALQVGPALSDNAADLDTKYSSNGSAGINAMTAAYDRWTKAGEAWPSKAREAFPAFMPLLTTAYTFCSRAALRDRLFFYDDARAVSLAMRDCGKMRQMFLLGSK